MNKKNNVEIITFRDDKEFRLLIDTLCLELRENRSEFIKKALQLRFKLLKSKGFDIPERVLL